MWKTFAPLLFMLSVAMNAAFASMWAIQEINARWPQTGRETTQEIWCPLHRQLNVTPEQWRRIEPRLREFHDQTGAVREELARLRLEMIGLIAADQSDREAITAKQQAIQACQQRMQKLVIEHLLAEKEILDTDQEKKLFDLMRERSTCAGPGRMMGFSRRSMEGRADSENAGTMADSVTGESQ